MVTVNVQRQIPRDAAKVWEILRDFGDISWVDGPEKVEVEGEGPGMVRRLYIPGMSPIDEIMESLDDAKRELIYTIPKNEVIPFDNYRATVTVTDKDGGAFIDWSCSLDPAGMSAEDATGLMEGNYNMLIDALDAKLAS